MGNGFKIVGPALLAALLSLSITAQAKAATAKPMECPAKTFEGFLEKFAEDIELQKKHTKFPLPNSDVNFRGDAERALSPVTQEAVEKDQFGLFPSKKIRSKEGLDSMDISDNGAVQKLVTVYREGSDYVLFFQFTAEKDCWRLTRKYSVVTDEQ